VVVFDEELSVYLRWCLSTRPINIGPRWSERLSDASTEFPSRSSTEGRSACYNCSLNISKLLEGRGGSSEGSTEDHHSIRTLARYSNVYLSQAKRCRKPCY